jgi:hypothetical protein
MSGNYLHKIQVRLYQKYLPWLIQNGSTKLTPHDYWIVFFKDANNEHYVLKSVSSSHHAEQTTVVLSPLLQGIDTEKQIGELPDMDSEIIHYKKNYALRYQGIITFTLDRYLNIITIKSAVARIKGKIVSGLKSDKETISSDRFNLLKLMVAQFIHQRPSRMSSGFNPDEIIVLLYGTLWYKHIKNESFKRKIMLLMESLVLTGDLTEENGHYYVQGHAITTLVEHEKEERRILQQLRMHKNIVRFMLVITVSTLLIILVLMAMAGIIDLQAVWQKILHIKPIRFMLKFI